MPRHLILDLDGTLVDSSGGIRAALAEAAAACSPPLPPPPEDVRRFIGPPIAGMAAALWPGLLPGQAVALAEAFRRLYDQRHCTEATPYPGIAHLLAELHGAGVHLFLATNKPVAATTRLLRAQLPDVPFTAVLCVDTLAGHHFAGKAEMLEHLLAGFRLDAAVTPYAGDTEADRSAARSVGMPFIAAGYGFGGLEHDAGDAAFAATPDDLRAAARRCCRP